MENVRILLRTLNDIYPSPRSASPETISGPAPGHTVPCSDCLRSGRVFNSETGWKLCPVCDGRGWRRRHRGEPAFDEYTGETVLEAKRNPNPIVGDVAPALGLDAVEVGPYAWERARAARDKSCSYPELERALSKLQIEAPNARHLITMIYFSGLDVRLTPVVRLAEGEVVAWLAREMRGRIRIPRAEYEEQQERRRKRVMALHWEGLEDREIARALGVSMRYVDRIISAARA